MTGVSRRVVTAATLLWLAYAVTRWATSAVWPALHNITGDFAAVFPSPYFARWRPDFPTGQVWEGGWYGGPLLHFVTLPLLALPRWWMVPPAWAFVNAVCLVLSFRWVWRLADVRGRLSWRTLCVIAGLWMAFQPLSTAYASGDIEIVELAFMLAGVSALTTSRETAAGVWLGLATTLKFLPIGFLGWCGLRGRWRVVVAGASSIAAVLLITGATLGWQESRVAAALASPETLANAGLHELSITSMFIHWSGLVDLGRGGLLWLPSDRAAQAAAAGRLASLLVLAGLGVILFGRRRASVSPYEIAVLFLTMFIAVPRNHDYYYLFALVPLSIVLARAVADRDRVAVAGAALAYGLMSPPVPFTWIDRSHVFAWPFAYVVNANNLPVIGALVLWVVVSRPLVGDETVGGRPARRWWQLAMAVVLLGAVTATVAAWRSVRLPANADIAGLTPPVAVGEAGGLAVSPDGSRVAYVSASDQLCVVATTAGARPRCLDTPRQARAPFFSPDGRRLAFVSQARVWIGDVDLSAASSVADADPESTLVWTVDPQSPVERRDGTLLVARTRGILRVNPHDGTTRWLVTAESGAGLWRDPTLLPDGDHVMFTVVSSVGGADGTIEVHAIRDATRVRVTSGSRATYDVATRRLLFLHAGRFVAAPFDVSTFALTGPAVHVTEPAVTANGTPLVAVSPSGTVVAVPAEHAPRVARSLWWIDRRGEARAMNVPPGDYDQPRVSPDGGSVAVLARAGAVDALIVNAVSSAVRRVVVPAAQVTSMVWNAGDGELAVAAGGPSVWTVGVDAPATLRWVGTPGDPRAVWLSGGTRDGRRLAGTDGSRLWLFDQDTARFAWVGGARERGAVFSADGRWWAAIAADGVVVHDATGLAGQLVVADPSASEPAWSADGRELFYRTADALWAVPMRDGARAGEPVRLFADRFARAQGPVRNFDVAPDGQHFVMVGPAEGAAAAATLSVLRHWPATGRH